MNVVFEEDGSFKVGTVLSESNATLQIETHTGKRTKVKASHVLMRFAAPDPAQLITQANALADSIDLDFLWECAPQEEFMHDQLAKDYFGAQPSTAQSFALLQRLHGAPVYFYRKGRGQYRPATEQTLKAALASVEKKKLQQQQVQIWADQLAAGQCPDEIRAQAALLLVNPDKNGIHFKALTLACDQAQLSPQRLLVAAKAFKTPFDLHWKTFINEYFPGGVGFKSTPLEWSSDALPLSPVRAFSIDDSSTTEIDDCLSVQWHEADQVTLGVHIAAPGAGIEHDSEIDLAARDRMSTLYVPSDKVTMMSDAIVKRFSLDAGQIVPALSLYVRLDLTTGQMLQTDTRLERITVADNLRHDQLDEIVTVAALELGGVNLPFGKELATLWKATLVLCAERDRVRGKPEARNRADYMFRVDQQTNEVQITERRRDAPLDRIVAEMMIMANNRWGHFLADHLVPGVYRGQTMGKVKMTTYPQPHQGLGVTHYGWFTSPLRRYTDMVNQRQLLAILDHQAPPFAQNDAGLFAVIAGFDARYSAYNDFQNRMEKYWCIRWVKQSGELRFEAVVVKDDMVRLLNAPLYFRLVGMPETAPGRTIRIDILEMDEIDLSVQARFVELVSNETSAPSDDVSVLDQDAADEPVPA